MLKKKVLLPALLVTCSYFTHAQNTERLPPPPPPEPPKVETPKFTPPVIVKDGEDFLNRNKTVANLAWQNSHIVIVHLKNKSKEKYDINDSKQRKAFTDKYGELPEPPPPPPPPPPAPPKVKA
jgi:hypothetical protein